MEIERFRVCGVFRQVFDGATLVGFRAVVAGKGSWLGHSCLVASGV